MLLEDPLNLARGRVHGAEDNVAVIVIESVRLVFILIVRVSNVDEAGVCIVESRIIHPVLGWRSRLKIEFNDL